MGAVKIIISDNVEMQFRRVAMKKFGYGKGALSEAADEALEEWSVREDNEHAESSREYITGLEKDPVGAIEGLLKKETKKRPTSVDLQHEACRIRVKNILAKKTSSN